MGRAAFGFATAALGGFLRASVQASANAEQVRGKFEAVFGSMSDDVEAFAKDFAQKIGQSTTSVLMQLSELQDLFVPLGFARKEAAKLSKQLITLTADVAAFNNRTEEEVALDFQRAIANSGDAVRKYGIIINEAAIKQELLSMGINKTRQQQTELERVQARVNLLMKGSADAFGFAEAEANTFTRQVSELQAQVSMVSKAIGDALVPAMQALIVVTIPTVKAFLQLNEFMDGAPARIVAIVAVVATLATALVALGVSARFAWRSIAGPLAIILLALEAIYETIAAIRRAWGDDPGKEAEEAAKRAKQAEKEIREEREKERQRSAQKSKTEIQHSIQGLFALDQLGRKIQEAMLAQDDPQKKTNELLAENNRQNEEQKTQLGRIERKMTGEYYNLGAPVGLETA